MANKGSSQLYLQHGQPRELQFNDWRRLGWKIQTLLHELSRGRSLSRHVIQNPTSGHIRAGLSTFHPPHLHRPQQVQHTLLSKLNPQKAATMAVKPITGVRVFVSEKLSQLSIGAPMASADSRMVGKRLTNWQMLRRGLILDLGIGIGGSLIPYCLHQLP